jgi:hypothetical protein
MNFNQENDYAANVAAHFQSTDENIFGSDREALCHYENGMFKSFDKNIRNFQWHYRDNNGIFGLWTKKEAFEI